MFAANGWKVSPQGYSFNLSARCLGNARNEPRRNIDNTTRITHNLVGSATDVTDVVALRLHDEENEDQCRLKEEFERAQ